MIVVTAPTGTIGKQVVTHLLAEGHPVRLIVRNASRLDSGTRERACIVEGSHNDPATLDLALEGADSLFWLAPVQPQKSLAEIYPGFAHPAARAVAHHGVGQVVAISALGRGTPWGSRAGIVTALIEMEDVLKSSGAAFRGLALPSFMDNLLRQAAIIKAKGVFFGTADPDQQDVSIAARDAGAFAARLLGDSRWIGQEHLPVFGPDLLSPNDMAETISQATGLPVRYQQISYDDLVSQQLSLGASDAFAQGFAEMLRAKSEGMDRVATERASPAVKTPFRQWCEEVLKPAIV